MDHQAIIAIIACTAARLATDSEAPTVLYPLQPAGGCLKINSIKQGVELQQNLNILLCISSSKIPSPRPLLHVTRIILIFSTQHASVHEWWR
jgi:hypothetical protein